METLEQLSDAQLRARLAQYGFPNLPVTDTTRKVLIKKLKLAIDGQTTKNRRETVAVTKFSSDEEPEKEDKSVKKVKTPNRRATVAVTEKASNGATTNGRETPTRPPSRRSSSRQTPAKDKAEIIQEDSDDDIIEIPIRRSRTNTPTLGKSETVRTSYKNKVEIVDEGVVEEPARPPPRNPSPAPTKTITTTTSTRRKTFTTSAGPTKVEEKPATPKFGRPSLTTSYNPRNTHKYSTTASDNNDDEPIDIDERSTPYLSNFAKRLSTLRATPLDAGMEKYKSMRDDGPSTSSYEYKSSYNYQSQAAPPKRGIMRDLSQIFDALDRKYNFRNILYVILIVMIIVAIYVIFM